MKLNRNKVLTIIALLIGVAFLGRTLILHKIKEDKKEAHKELVENSKIVNESGDKNSEEEYKKLKNILDNAKDNSQSIDSVKFDEYTPIDGTFSLGKINSEYYLYHIKSSEAKKLPDVDIARVCYVKNENDDSEFNGLFIHKENRWYLIDENGNVMADLGKVNIDDKTTFVIKGTEINIK